MQFVETLFMMVESFMQLALGLLKLIAILALFAVIVSNPLIFLFVIVFCPGVLSFALTLALMK